MFDKITMVVYKYYLESRKQLMWLDARTFKKEKYRG